ncbi:MAG: hypothetical protein OEW16_08545, partial [Gammaproteobacteria bacterium]|nr:hypothetical protein [Gammaproteobacteria bacterium]
TLFFAAQFLDLLWPLLVLAGVERLSIAPQAAIFPLVFESYPWSHSLLFALIWGVGAGGFYWGLRRDGRAAIVIGALVLSHWFLDLVVHLPDLPLWPGDAVRLGFGLWNTPLIALAIEIALLIGGATLYLSSSRPAGRAGTWGTWSLIAFLALIQLGNTFGPPPPSPLAVTWTAMAMWLLVFLGWWTDRARQQAI